MKYRIEFASHKVGDADMEPFEVDTPDTYGVAATSVELSRLIRNRVAHTIAATGHDDLSTVGRRTQIIVNLTAQDGSVHYGLSTIGAFNIYPHQ